MNPSAKARAAGAPVEADISKLEPGALLRVKWRGKPIWIVKRTPEMLAALPTLDSQLTDPNLGGATAAGLLQESHPLHQARHLGGDRHLHPPGLLTSLPSGSGAG